MGDGDAFSEERQMSLGKCCYFSVEKVQNGEEPCSWSNTFAGPGTNERELLDPRIGRA